MDLSYLCTSRNDKSNLGNLLCKHSQNRGHINYKVGSQILERGVENIWPHLAASHIRNNHKQLLNLLKEWGINRTWTKLKCKVHSFCPSWGKVLSRKMWLSIFNYGKPTSFLFLFALNFSLFYPPSSYIPDNYCPTRWY